jgi:glycosyltransferase involved in cell wall biosynthesis
MSRTCPITAVIPTYNRAALVGRAIDSVLAQTSKPSQILVVDDGSVDNTAAVCAKYGDRVEYVRQENAGASRARNHGIRLARYPWVGFLDSDDYWSPSHLERMVAAIGETSGIAAFYFADMQLPDVEGGGTLWQRIGFRPCAPYQLIRDASAWMLMERQPTMLQASVFSRRALDNVGGFDARFCSREDSHLFCLLGIGGIACAVSGVGCVQTADDTSSVRLTTAIPLASTRSAEYLCLMWADVFRTCPLSPKWRRLVRSNLASSYWEQGRDLIQSRRYGAAISILLKAIVSDPHLAGWVLRHGTRKGYGGALRES